MVESFPEREFRGLKYDKYHISSKFNTQRHKRYRWRYLLWNDALTFANVLLKRPTQTNFGSKSKSGHFFI